MAMKGEPCETCARGSSAAACSPRWIYHYCAVHAPKTGGTAYTDGIATQNKPIITWDDYMELKSAIVSKFEPPIPHEKLTITSITLLENDKGVPPLERNGAKKPEQNSIAPAVGTTDLLCQTPT